jgi:site-specific DNA recombinase
MIAAIYARKSTEQAGVADDAKSVRRQVEHATAYAKRQGWAVDDGYVFIDDGVSGAEFAGRPGYMRLLNALGRKAPFNVLIVSELSRLGREQLETGYALKQLSQAGVRIFSYMEGREVLLDSPTDKFLLAAVNFASDIERDKARQRTRDALERKARQGHVAGGSCFGYDNITITGPNGGRSHVERRINRAEAAVVRRAFELAARGIGLRRICWTLNDEGALAPRSQQGRPRAWAPSSVRTLLYRQLYRGLIIWAATKKRDGWGRTRQQPRPESEWIRVEAPNLRIIPEALWNAAHAELKKTRDVYLRANDGKLFGRPASGIESKYLLPGISRCAICGGGMLVRTGSHGNGRAHFYACSSYHLRGRSVCKNGFMESMKQVDRAVLERFQRQLVGDGILDEVLDAAVAQLAPATEEVKSDRAGLQRTMKRLDAEIERITSAIATGGQMNALLDGLKTRESEREQLRRRLAQGEISERRMAATPTRLREQLAERFAEWASVLQRHPAQARQVLKKLLVGPLKFTPQKGFYTFEGEVSFAKMLTDMNFPILVASPPGFEPGFQP